MAYYYGNSHNEYINRRKNDNARTSAIERFTDKVYRENGLSMRRVYDSDTQQKGVDLVQNVDGETRYIDEKFAINYYNKDLRTFAFELCSHNNYNDEGWLISPHMITTHYCVLWFRSDENCKHIDSYDLCYISKKRLMDYLYSVGYYDGIVDDFVGYWAGTNNKNARYYSEKDNRLYRNLRNGVRIVQSLQYDVEQPINIVVPRAELYKLAEYHFHN